jgi:hypothetical protein
MSSTNRGGAGRAPLDQYWTPDGVAQACVETLDLSKAKYAVEPSVGGGAFARAIRRAAPQVHITGYDLDGTVAGQADCDVFAVADWATVHPEPAPDVILGNPPYGEAQAHIEHALTCTRQGGIVGMLLRLAFAEGVGRQAFWAKYGAWLDGVFVLAKRPSFTGGATDSCAYAWFVWRVGGEGRRIFVPGWAAKVTP